KRFVVLEVVCRDVDFKPIDVANPGGDQKRQHVLVAEAATFIDEEHVRDALEKQKFAILAAKEEKSGQERMEGADLELDHFAGKHAEGLVEGCASCDTEARLAAEEAEAANAPTPIGKGKKGSP